MQSTLWLEFRMHSEAKMLKLRQPLLIHCFCAFPENVSWLVRRTTDLEVAMNSIERMVEYLKFDSERDEIIPDNRPDPDWPFKGAIFFDNLRVRYRPELDDVLKGITFSVASRQKIGVCGRTGEARQFKAQEPDKHVNS